MGSVIQGVGGFVDNTLGTNIFGPNATDKALDAQRGATGDANSVLAGTYDTQKKELEPWKQAGSTALSMLQSGDWAKNLEMDPGYQFRLQQGNDAINASMAARGLGNSGAALKSLTEYGQNFASNEYDKAYNRQYQNLSQLAGFGQDASNSLVNAAGAYGQGVSGNYTGMGNAAASANIAQANRTSGLLGQGLTAGALYFSDERLKTDIEDIPKEDIAELKAAIRGQKWRYKDPKYGRGEWFGVMAQALEKTKLGKGVVRETKDGTKVIDVPKAVSLLFVALAEG